MAALGLCACGCQSAKPASSSATVKPVFPGVQAAEVFPPPVNPGSTSPLHVVDIAFDIMHVEWPVAGAGDARKVWNHVDEMRIRPEQVQLLARNGLRMGAASPSSWPAIQTLLDAAGARIRSEHLFPQRGAALPVRLGELAEGDSVFCYHADGRLVGKTFSGGDKMLLIDYALHPQLDGCTDLGVSFEIARESGRNVWQRRDGVLQQVPEYERHGFTDLGTLLTMHPGEYLVVGPRDDLKNDHLVGTRFFVGPGSDEKTLTLLFLAPRPYQIQTPMRQPS